ncbi:ribonuclease H-like protein [Athelia psychrophila]|uniref:RNA exonuclease 4 n=1 Tax=Athelia psychrophila TaxID=1759441 RepID=A0A166RKE4_9AGAM|nr:ribonuclease H-like protein [Fibularhizoctonia sp. CBS 109695]
MPGSSSKAAGSSSKSKVASSNWLALKKKLPAASAENTSRGEGGRPRKKRKIQDNHEPTPSTSSTKLVPEPADFPRHTAGALHHPVNDDGQVEIDLDTPEKKNGESVAHLRKMVLGKMEYTSTQEIPGKFLALDCEMVGVGPEGAESSLARVSLVNYHGAVQLDAFVAQRERVTDYRTQWSGIRASDMTRAQPFEDVQAKVAKLLEGRVLVGHAVHNDLKVLMLGHPRGMTRDTQYHAGKARMLGTNRPALRNLVKAEVGVAIQEGEHSSVIDARATMALYRLHRKEWDKGFSFSQPSSSTSHLSSKKRAHSEDPDESPNEAPAEEFPGGGRKGVSSGLGAIVRHKGGKGKGAAAGGGGGEKKKWWTELSGGTGAGGGGGKKGSIRL